MQKRTGPVTSNLAEEEREQLCALLGNVELTLLYKASVHEYQAAVFHQRCDNKGPTLLVAYNSSGYIFGGYTSVDYAQSEKYISDREAFLFSFQGKNPVYSKVNSGNYARYDDAGMPNFGQQLTFCNGNGEVVYNEGGKSYSFNAKRLYGNDTELTECEVYKVKEKCHIWGRQEKEKPWRNIRWTSIRRDELMEMIRNYKPLVTSVRRARILMIGPVGAGKSSFFNSINSIFTGHVTHKAMSGSAGTSLTTQFRTYPVKDGRGGKPLPFVLCDTMGLEEQSGAGLDIEDISSILQGHVPDRYKFNSTAPFRPDDQKASRPASLQEKIHCVVYVIDASKISLMSDKLEEKLAVIRREINSLDIPQMVLMTKVDEACPHVEKDLYKIYASSYIKSKIQEVSSRLGVPVSCVLPVKNYSQELELELNCDVLLLSALQQMFRLADDYLDDADADADD
ncbi:interferon-induced protein 44-like [Onychostoma macrolepis]|uniref:interferon-induced protein 44-like n=1 Tax=Onychostoma macrolepis TaxID=369639 RepID=UPI00272A9257|nr:interferon-induced protein 44-like [Onychostoma macrolepis]